MHNKLLNLFRGNARKGSLRSEGNTIFLYDIIVSSEEEVSWYGGVSAEGFARLLAQMTGPVTIRINSPGGDVFGGRAMAAAIRGHEGEVTVIVDGCAASAASTVAIAGDRVLAQPDAMLMVHRAWTMTMGNLADHLSTAALLEKIDETIAESYAAKAGAREADWIALMDAETWFTAAEAQAAGLVDELLPARADKPDSRLAWDLTAFNNAPAPPPEPEQQADTAEAIAARQRRLAVELLKAPA